MNEKILCNASPVIFLSKIERLHLLSDLFSEVLIPDGVWNEVNQRPDDAAIIFNELRASSNLTVFTVKNRTAVMAMIGRLHLGEVEVIVGAGELGIPNVILDDGYARSKAKQMGLNVTGTLGILIAGHKKCLIDDLSSDLEKLIDIGFRISNSIVQQIKNM